MTLLVFPDLDYNENFSPFPVLLELGGIRYVTATHGNIESFGSFVGSPDNRVADIDVLSRLFVANQAMDFLDRSVIRQSAAEDLILAGQQIRSLEEIRFAEVAWNSLLSSAITIGLAVAPVPVFRVVLLKKICGDVLTGVIDLSLRDLFFD